MSQLPIDQLPYPERATAKYPHLAAVRKASRQQIIEWTLELSSPKFKRDYGDKRGDLVLVMQEITNHYAKIWGIETTRIYGA